MRQAEFASDASSTSAADHIDRLCDWFEAELKLGHRPDLDHVLDQTPDDQHEPLLRELLLLTLEYAGTSAQPENWQEPRSSSLAADLQPQANEQTPPQHAQSTDAINKGSSQLSQTAELVNDITTRIAVTAATPAIAGYEILDELGRGGMGIVYRARQISLDRMVALKVIQSGRFTAQEESSRAHWLERFRTEVKAASRLDHKNIVTIYDIGQCGDHPYYAMQLVEGPSLGKLVQDGPLLPERAARYLEQISRTVDLLHATGVVHRDLKPSNILIEQADDTPVVTDFGLAKLADAEQHVTLSTEGFGSPPYMAPEQVLHATSVTRAADIYSLGATLYHLLTGRPPFQAATPPEIARQIIFCEPVAPRQLNASIPRDLETICLKCLEKDEHRRYATARDMADDLRRFLDKRPIVARPLSAPARVWRWCRRNRAWTALIVCVALLLLVSVGTAAVIYVQRELAAAASEVAIAEKRAHLSEDCFDRSQFALGANVQNSLPWLIACLKLDAHTPREFATLQRIHSVLAHGPQLQRIVWSDGLVLCASPHPSDDRVLAGYSHRSAKIWSVDTGQCLHTLRHDGPVRQAVCGHQGKLAATATDGMAVMLWRFDTGEQHTPPLAHVGAVKRLEFSPDDKSLITSSSDGLVRIWNTSDGTLRREIEADSSGNSISCLAVSPDGTYGASSADNARVLVWDLKTGEVRPFTLEHRGLVTDIQFNASAATIVTASDDGEVKIWDVLSGRLLREFTRSTPVIQALFTPDEKHVIIATHAGAGLCPLNDPQQSAVEITHDGLKNAVVSRGGTFLLTIGNDQAAKLWSLTQGKMLETAFAPGCEVTGAKFTDNDNSLVVFSKDGTVRVWSLVDHLLQKARLTTSPGDRLQSIDAGKSVATIGGSRIQVTRAAAPNSIVNQLAHDSEITAACTSADSRWIAFGDAAGRLVVWERKTGKTTTHPGHHDQPMRVVAWRRDNQMVAVGDAAGHVTLNDISTGSVLQSFDLNGPPVDLAFSPSGNLLLAADAKTAHLIQLNATDDARAWAYSLTGEIRAARFSPNGTSIVVFGTDSRVLVSDVSTGLVRRLHTDTTVNDAIYSPDSALLLTAGQNGIAQVWRVGDGTPLHKTAIRHDEPLLGGCFSPDGRSVALCDEGGMVRIWQVETGQPTTIPIHHGDGIAHLQFTDIEKLLTITPHGEMRLIDCTPTIRNVDELETISMVRCVRYVDALGTLQPVSRDEFPRKLEQLERRQSK